jgi:hypothetical protein
VVEDFHYLSIFERRALAFDLKALWDMGLFVILIGVWSEQNMLLALNPDLAGRVKEVPIVWTKPDLRKIFDQGGAALKLSFATSLTDRAIAECYENAGILQTLILSMLDHAGIREEQPDWTVVDSLDALESAGLDYAEQLNPLYQLFANRVASGIRTRKNATGIYAHAMKVVLSASDEELIRGLPLNHIFREANSREPRIQKGNLKSVMEKIDSLQVDEDGRGLVISYNEETEDVTVVDRQLLLYRRYSTVRWPWERLIREAEQEDLGFAEDSC